ncbi:transcription termination/antitermination NusG family protein [Desulfurobacterium sp.]|uniref:transcription termination/antitermination protein NusG n=1 Tax=Desulfurobacterium sp. TaxID=2004706 RepID=UPI002604EF02|nr:transcription termination/antitermination NusG family protein [Desulfurobacterium sp.]
MSNVMNEPKWYIVSIKPRKEKVVFVQFERINIEYFYPIVKVKKRKLLKEEPLFPGYMFAKFSIAEHFNNVRYTRGVKDIVRFGRNIPHIDESFIENLKEKTNSIIDFEKADLKEGEVVKIKEGPFRGLIGQVLKLKKGDERVVLLLKAASMSPKIEIPISFVEKVS